MPYGYSGATAFGYREPLSPTTLRTGAENADKTTSTVKKDNKFSADPADIRRRLGLNQQQFWPMIGVTQSGGSRYESGRRMPKPVRELLRIVHIEGIPLAQIRGDEFALLAHLKKARPGLYRELKAAVQRARKIRDKD